ncbi:MAG: hypothetical protein D6790_20950 [Caldilineae bacterium]|nr:MAG: hypothetical protein D6790_20950 [Caldilineae bacterium]
MVKDRSILDLLALIDLASNGWISVDHWDADLCAIGIAKMGDPRRLVYVSTFERLPGRYDYECEVKAGPNAEDYVTVDSGEDVDLERLRQVLRRHLGG